MAYYLWHLGDALPQRAGASREGADVYARDCASCHGGPGLAGPPVTAESISSPVAEMESAARGTGMVQSTSLRGVSDRELLLFGGDAVGLAGLLDPARKTGGHPFGQALSPAERQALCGYLSGL